MNTQIFSKIYGGLTTEEKFNTCIELIESDLSDTEAGPEIDKIKASLKLSERPVFYSYVHKYIFKRYGQQQKDLIIQCLWKNYFQISLSQQTRALLLFYVHANTNSSIDLEIINKKIEDWSNYNNQPHKYQEKIRLENELFQTISKERVDNIKNIVENTFQFERHALEEVKTICIHLGNWKEEFYLMKPLDLIEQTVEHIKE